MPGKRSRALRRWERCLWSPSWHLENCPLAGFCSCYDKLKGAAREITLAGILARAEWARLCPPPADDPETPA